MCTAATYKTKDFYFGRTFDYEFSYGEEVVITPRKYPFAVPGEFEKVLEEGLLFDFCPQVVVDTLKVLEDLL